jgi:hypothetical protein
MRTINKENVQEIGAGDGRLALLFWREALLPPWGLPPSLPYDSFLICSAR